MTLDQAYGLSRELADAGVSHHVEIGVADGVLMRCSISLALIRSVRGGIADRFVAIEEIASRHDATLQSSLLDQGYTLVSRRDADAIAARIRR